MPDHELNDCKAEHVFGKGYRMMTDEELQANGLHKGFIGPVNLPEGIRLVCDESLRESKQWVCGANEADYHFTGACPERDCRRAKPRRRRPKPCTRRRYRHRSHRSRRQRAGP